MPPPTTASVDCSKPWHSNQGTSVPPGPALTVETTADPTDDSVSFLDTLPPTFQKDLSIGSGLQSGANDPSINKVYPAEGQPDVLGAIDPALEHIPQIDKSKMAVARPSPAPEAQNEVNRSLLLAVEERNFGKVKTLISLGAQVNPQNVDEELPLHVAIRHHDVSMTKLLLQMGANLTQEWHGTPPIHLASRLASRGDNNDSFGIVHLLLNHGASASSLDARQEQPLHAVLGQRVGVITYLVELLIQRGADVNARTSADKTPLHLSCDYTNVDNVRKLLIHGADPTLICEGGKTPLHLLAESAALSIHIHDAFPALFRLLYEHGADVNAKDKLGDTPLHVLAKGRFVSSSVPGNAKVAFFELLISHGADINAQNKAGDTPFHTLITVWVGSVYPAEFEAVVRLSIQHGVNADAQNKAGDTPLHISVRKFRKSEVSIQLLLEHGVNVNVQNEVGDTPLHVLVGQPLFRWHGWTEIRAIIQLLLQHGADVNTPNKVGVTPLHTLFDKRRRKLYHQPGYEAVVELLLQHETDFNTRNKAGDTPLRTIINRGLEEGSTFFPLIDHGAEVGI